MATFRCNNVEYDDETGRGYIWFNDEHGHCIRSLEEMQTLWGNLGNLLEQVKDDESGLNMVKEPE